MFKRMAIFPIIMCMIISCTAFVFAAGDQPAKPRRIKVGFPEVYGFSELSANGEYSGLIYDYLIEISKYTGWEYDFICTDLQQCKQMLMDGELDLMGRAYYQEEMEQYVTYSQYVSGFTSVTINVLDSNRDIFSGDYFSFSGMSIGIIGQSGLGENLTGDATARNAALVEFLQRNGIKDCTLVEFEQHSDLTDALDLGKVDAILATDTEENEGQRIVASFGSHPYYFAAANSSKDIIPTLNKAMNNISLVDYNYTSNLHNKYFSSQAQYDLSLSAAEQAYITSAAPLAVTVNPNMQPMQYFNENGEFRGITADVLRLVSDKTGLVFNVKKTDSLNQSIQLIKSGQAQIFAGATVGGKIISDNRMISTNEYIAVNRMRIQSNKSKKMTHKYPRVALISGYDFKSPSGDVPAFYNNISECVKAIGTGEVDYALTSTYVFNYYTQMNGYKNLSALPILMEEDSFCMGIVRPADVNLITIMNKTINSITRNEMQAIVNKNTMADLASTSLAAYLRQNPVVAILVCVIFLVIAVGIVLLFVYSKLYSKKKLYKFSTTDDVTGGGTFSKFKMDIDELLKSGEQYALVSLDIDKFKIINDMFGYSKGNDVLRAVSNRISVVLKEKETHARANADNFCILITYKEDKDIVDRVGQIASEMTSYIEGYHIELSFGIYKIAGSEDEIDGIVDRASLARRTVKSETDRNYAFFDETIRRNILKEKEIENLMEAALADEEYELYFQPKYLFSDESIVGAEALVRWNSKVKGMIYPDSFIPIFEKNGFIRSLDRYMFERSVRFIARMDEQTDKYKNLTVSVNLSRIHLNDQNLAEELLAVTNIHGVASNRIEVELTESVAFENVDRLVKTMESLKSAGFLLSIDDFGSGYSSLNTLKDLPADVIKFDRGFLQESSNNSRGKKIIQGLVSMTSGIGLLTVAEGVETKEQADFLRECGCDIAQGYYYSKPIPAAEFEVLLGLK